jgi:hypothetical protein
MIWRRLCYAEGLQIKSNQIKSGGMPRFCREKSIGRPSQNSFLHFPQRMAGIVGVGIDQKRRSRLGSRFRELWALKFFQGNRKPSEVQALNPGSPQPSTHPRCRFDNRRGRLDHEIVEVRDSCSQCAHCGFTMLCSVICRVHRCALGIFLRSPLGADIQRYFG